VKNLTIFHEGLWRVSALILMEYINKNNCNNHKLTLLTFFPLLMIIIKKIE